MNEYMKFIESVSYRIPLNYYRKIYESLLVAPWGVSWIWKGEESIKRGISIQIDSFFKLLMN